MHEIVESGSPLSRGAKKEKSMEPVKIFSGRSFIRIALLMILLISLFDTVIYLAIKLVVIQASAQQAIAEGSQFDEVFTQYFFVKEWFYKFFIPASVGIGIVFTLIFWAVLRSLLNTIIKKQNGSEEKTSGVQSSAEENKIKENNNKRLFLHLLSVLQREGRLVDFFFEKLDQYDDAQIGAAVRSIHENCSKTVSKYLSPEPVIDNNEGESVTVESGFDPASVKLTGNVTGEPPFKGVLRHKGWQAAGFELPVLSDRENPMIIAPAEVEIE